MSNSKVPKLVFSGGVQAAESSDFHCTIDYVSKCFVQRKPVFVAQVVRPEVRASKERHRD